LNDIKEAREKNAQASQVARGNPQMVMVGQPNVVGALPNQGQGQGQGQIQSGFQHLQHPMQASQLPMQQGQPPMSSAMDSANAPPHMAQPQQIQMGMQQRPPQQRPAGPALAPQDHARVNELAASIAASATPQQLDQIRTQISKMPVQHRQMMLQQGIDPLQMYFRNQAMRLLRGQRQAMANPATNQHGNIAVPPGMIGAPGSVAMAQRQPSQNPVMTQMDATGGMGGNPNFDAFLGNMENLMGQQQADAMRSQQQGHLVVPASTGSNPQLVAQSMAGAPVQMAQPPSNQNATNPVRPVPNPNATAARDQLFNQEKAQAAQLQLAQTVQARTKAQMAMQGQPNGMNPMAPRQPQQSPAMPTQNTPHRPPSQQSIQGTPQHRPQQGVPAMGQQVGPSVDGRFGQPAQMAQMAMQQPQRTAAVTAQLNQNLHQVQFCPPSPPSPKKKKKKKPLPLPRRKIRVYGVCVR
jgi:hypothetical protein